MLNMSLVEHSVTVISKMRCDARTRASHRILEMTCYMSTETSNSILSLSVLSDIEAHFHD